MHKFCHKKMTFKVISLNGTPKRIRIAVYTVKGCCPRPLDDGGLFLSTSSILHEAKLNVNHFFYFIKNECNHPSMFCLFLQGAGLLRHSMCNPCNHYRPQYKILYLDIDSAELFCCFRPNRKQSSRSHSDSDLLSR